MAAPHFCPVTLGGKTVLNPPAGFGKTTNYFRMTTGAARYGRGCFLMTQEDFDKLNAHGKKGLADLVLADGTNTLTLSVRIAACVPAITASGSHSNIVEALVFDKRCDQFTPIDRSFNCIAEPFVYDASADTPDWTYWDSTTDNGDPYNWDDVVSSLGLPQLPISVDWTPRNLDFSQTPLADAADRIAAELFLVVGFDWETDKISFEKPGDLSDDNDILNDLTDGAMLIGGGDFTRSDFRPPGKIKCIFQAVNVDTPDPYGFADYSKDYDTHSGNDAVQPLHIGNQPAYYSNGDYQNKTDLDAIAADLGERAYNFISVDEAAWEFAGIQKFKPDGAIREITWISDPKGPRTRIVMHNGRDLRQFDEGRTMEFGGNQLVAAMGTTVTSMSPAGTRYVISRSPIVATVRVGEGANPASDGLKGGARYHCFVVTGNVHGLDLSLPQYADLELVDPGESVPAQPNGIFENEAENLFRNSHWIDPGTFVEARFVGYTKDSPPKPIYRARVPPPLTTLKITGFGQDDLARGAGRYNAVVILPQARDVDPATDLNLPDPGEGGGKTVLFENDAESGKSGHALSAGDVVEGRFAGYTKVDTGGAIIPIYRGLAAPAGGEMFVCEITGQDTGDGQYTGFTLAGTSSATAGSPFRMNAGMTKADDALLCNLDEQNLTGWRLKAEIYTLGKIVGTTSDGKKIVYFHGGTGNFEQQKQLSSGGKTPNTTTWSRATDAPNGHTGAKIRIQTSEWWDDVNFKFMRNYRDMSIDGRGMILGISAETAEVVTDTNDCTSP